MQNEPLLFGFADEKSVREPLRYTLCGLDNVYLCNGFTKEVVDGEVYTSVKAVEDLHEMIAFTLSVLRRPLVSKEVAFLRRHIGLTQAEMAVQLGVSRKTVNEYENSRAIPRTAQVMLQLTAGIQLVKRLTARVKENGRGAHRFMSLIDEMASWLLEVRAACDASETPPAFIIDATIGSWKRGGLNGGAGNH